MKIFTTVFLLSSIQGCLSLAEDAPLAARTVSQIPSASPTADPNWQHNKTRQAKHVHDFFKLFGWLRRNDTIKDDDLPKAIKKIQKTLREPETGIYDERMEIIMSKPRCGTIQPYNETDAKIPDTNLHKRYVLWGAKWTPTTVTYRFLNYTSDITTERQKAIVSAAFAQWNQYLPISIIPAPSSTPRADIHVRFMSMGSLEQYAFTNMIADGLSLVSGLINVTFNDDWDWNDDRLFNYTAIHEIGHALGLSHSKVEEAIMFPYYDPLTRALHSDDKAAVHSLYGWREPRWNRIDTNSGTKYIVQVSSLPQSPSTLDGLYQLRSTGQVLYYNPSGSWTVVDSNKDTIQIAGAGGKLYQRHTDGSVYRYTGTGSNWQYIGASSDNIIDIVAASDQIYQRRKDGWVARWSGSGTSWNTIEQPRSSKQIAVTDSKVLWNLLTNGDLVRSEWPYGAGWTIVDQNPLNSAIATGGDEFYKLQTDGLVVWLDSVAYYWKIIEDAGATSIYAAGSYLYSKHADNSTWRYTGTPYVWEQLDTGSNIATVIGDRKGSVWEMMASGDVMKLIS